MPEMGDLRRYMEVHVNILGGRLVTTPDMHRTASHTTSLRCLNMLQIEMKSLDYQSHEQSQRFVAAMLEVKVRHW